MTRHRIQAMVAALLMAGTAHGETLGAYIVEGASTALVKRIALAKERLEAVKLLIFICFVIFLIFSRPNCAIRAARIRSFLVHIRSKSKVFLGFVSSFSRSLIQER